MQQKVYVRGGKQEEEPLELEVYNQGMFKTELCNKWQETGTCPYGDHCQFAHGIEELRPVIRHPRYKTEVCRMVLAGDVCPYGHRCHFRHALTDQERFMGHLNSRSIKLNWQVKTDKQPILEQLLENCKWGDACWCWFWCEDDDVYSHIDTE